MATKGWSTRIHRGRRPTTLVHTVVREQPASSSARLRYTLEDVHASHRVGRLPSPNKRSILLIPNVKRENGVDYGDRAAWYDRVVGIYPGSSNERLKAKR